MVVAARFLLMLLVSSLGLWPCTCGRGAWAPACESYYSGSAVFLGTVLDHDDDGSGKFTQRTLYLVRVDEAFRGLDVTQTEVFIDPGSFSSCYTHYAVGKQYLFVAGGPASFAAMISFKEPSLNKPFPVRWAARTDMKVYVAAGCSPTREASRVSEDLAWLRARERGASKTRVYGMALQNYAAFYRPPHPDEDVPLPGARIVLEGNGQQFTTSADDEGRYSFEGIPPGSYSIVAEKSKWTASRKLTVDLHAGGCAERDLSLGSDGVVQGTVLDHKNNPVNDVRVELVRVLPDSGIARSYSNWADTDQQGRFRIERVAAGTFVLGVNIGSAPTDREPYLTTFYPGVESPSSARHFTFEPNVKVSDLVLRLPPPLAKRTISVRVYWADGTPVETEARAFADHRGKRAAFESAKAGNVVELALLEGLDYTISADWFTTSRAPVRRVTSEEVNLSAGEGTATVDIRLKSQKP